MIYDIVQQPVCLFSRLALLLLVVPRVSSLRPKVQQKIFLFLTGPIITNSLTGWNGTASDPAPKKYLQ